MANNDKMTTAETTAWLVGQYVMAQNLVEAFASGDDLDAVLNECLKQIGESARDNGNMTLFFSALSLRRELGEASKI